MRGLKCSEQSLHHRPSTPSTLDAEGPSARRDEVRQPHCALSPGSWRGGGSAVLETRLLSCARAEAPGHTHTPVKTRAALHPGLGTA